MVAGCRIGFRHPGRRWVSTWVPNSFSAPFRRWVPTWVPKSVSAPYSVLGVDLGAEFGFGTLFGRRVPNRFSAPNSALGVDLGAEFVLGTLFGAGCRLGCRNQFRHPIRRWVPNTCILSLHDGGSKALRLLASVRPRNAAWHGVGSQQNAFKVCTLQRFVRACRAKTKNVFYYYDLSGLRLATC